MPGVFQEVEASRCQENLLWLCWVWQPWAQDAFTTQAIVLVLIYVRSWIGTRFIMWLEGLCQWKVPMTQSGNKPANFGLHGSSIKCTTAYPRVLLHSCTASLKPICVRNVLHPAKWITIFRGLPQFYNICWFGVESLKLSACFPCCLPTFTSNIQQKATLPALSKFRHNSLSQTNFSLHTQLLSQLHPQQHPTTLTFSLTNTLPCVKRTFADRTSRHSL
jgi:hypothetical protein